MALQLDLYNRISDGGGGGGGGWGVLGSWSGTKPQEVWHSRAIYITEWGWGRVLGPGPVQMMTSTGYI